MAAGGGFSAAGAGKINRRVAPVRQIAQAARYTIHDSKKGKTHEGCTLKAVIALCPGIKQSTLKRRLESGERTLSELQRSPVPVNGRRSKMGARRK